VTEATQAQTARTEAAAFRSVHNRIADEVGKVIVGQKAVVEAVLSALFAGGHVLLEGVPGLGKTMLVRALGEALQVSFSRIQFTPDMMPADIQGTSVLVEVEGGGHEMQFQEGPLVANLILADEINRATPKTQSALLEAMQERQITVGRRTMKLSEPYCVMATQNPIEQEGTYPLPEAQLDRFLFKVVVGYPEISDYKEIMNLTTGNAIPVITPVSSSEEILAMRQIVRSVPVPEHVQDYAIRLVVSSQPRNSHAPVKVNEYVSLGSSPRGVQALLLAGKVRALLSGRFAVSSADIQAVAKDVLRHRILVNFQGQADGVTPDHLVDELLRTVPTPGS
jgi:MoxR-like ATPase